MSNPLDPQATQTIGDLAGPVNIVLTEGAEFSPTFYLTMQDGSPIDLSANSVEFTVYSPASQTDPPIPLSPNPDILLHITSEQEAIDNPSAPRLYTSGNAILFNIPTSDIDALAPPALDWSAAAHQIYLFPTATPEKRTRIMAGRVTYSLSGQA